MELIGCLLMGAALYIFIVYILPFLIQLAFTLSSTAIALAAAAAALVGLYIAVKHYIRAIGKHINFRHWTWKRGDEPAHRSYFFGPGYVQLWNTVCEAFRGLPDSVENVNDIAGRIGASGDGFWGFCLLVLSWVWRVAGYLSIYGFGALLGLVLALIHGSVTTAVMLVIYVIFTVTWLIDGAYLMHKRIRSICPVCKERYRIPMFMCDGCGEKHYKLVPGPYGIFHHRCTCGKSLPCTFLNGRSTLEA
ncbi:MAG: hypothetical protein IJY28_02790, partial [Clostridia bacterium]|nr:hypothetical protein [Clostridia bacterium]